MYHLMTGRKHLGSVSSYSDANGKRDSVVGTATSYPLDGSGFESTEGKKKFSFSKWSTLEPTEFPIQMTSELPPGGELVAALIRHFTSIW
jgi:hypothetical protein